MIKIRSPLCVNRVFRTGHLLKIAVTKIDGCTLFDAFGDSGEHGALNEINPGASHRC
jgi:hypothetical protein